MRELMINDRVVAFDDVAKVVRAENDGLFYVEYKDYVRKAILDVDIKPIPVTEDVLLENGFKRTGSFTDIVEYSLREIESILCVYYKVDCENPYFYAEIANVDVEIEYVHELQHLLRLCGWGYLADNLKI